MAMAVKVLVMEAQLYAVSASMGWTCLLPRVAEEKLRGGDWAVDEGEAAADYAVAGEHGFEARLEGFDLSVGGGSQKDDG